MARTEERDKRSVVSAEGRGERERVVKREE